MTMSSVIYSSISIVMLAMSVGCNHAHRVVNTGDSMLYAVTVQSGEQKFGHGYLPPKAVKGYSGSMKIVRTPAPVVSWKTAEGGPSVVQEVKLESNPGCREVVFEIDGKTAKGIIRDR